jgi:hypothetical protein
MAIKSNYKKFGVSFSDAYTKISTIEYSNGLKDSWEMSEDPTVPPQKVQNKVLRVEFQSQTFPSATSTDMIDNKTHRILLQNADNLFDECYAYLKTLPEFLGAVDA